MIDAHCHVHTLPDVEASLARAAAAGVELVSMATIGPEDEPALYAALACPDPPRRLGALGLHPYRVTPEEGPGLLEGLAERLDDAFRDRPAGLVAVGETGLDRRRRFRPAASLQERALVIQIECARKWGLPLVLHCVRAHQRLLRLLRSHRAPPSLLHSWSGSAEMVGAFVKLGHFISFAGPVCSPDNRKVSAALAAVPLDRLLIETDAPDQTPQPARPGRCEPAHLRYVFEAVRQARGLSAAQLDQRLRENHARVFRA